MTSKLCDMIFFQEQTLPMLGDIIRFPRTGYSHFGIYIGEILCWFSLKQNALGDGLYLGYSLFVWMCECVCVCLSIPWQTAQSILTIVSVLCKCWLSDQALIKWPRAEAHDDQNLKIFVYVFSSFYSALFDKIQTICPRMKIKIIVAWKSTHLHFISLAWQNSQMAVNVALILCQKLSWYIYFLLIFRL